MWTTILISCVASHAKTLMDCVPKGKLIQGESLYITYSLELDGADSSFLRLKKGYYSDNDQSYVERLLYGIGFEWVDDGKRFALSYLAPDGKALFYGDLWDKTSGDSQTGMAEAQIFVNLTASRSPVGTLINSSESEIKEWNCQFNNLPLLTQLKRPKPRAQ